MIFFICVFNCLNRSILFSIEAHLIANKFENEHENEYMYITINVNTN